MRAELYERYQAWPAALRNGIAQYLRKPLTGSHHRCLFLGCGTGINEVLPFARRARSGWELVAGDVDSSFLRRLKEHRVSNLTVRRIDITTDLDPLGTFDLVSLFFVIHRIPDWRPAIDQVVRRVAPGGSLYISEFVGRGGLIFRSNAHGGAATDPGARMIRRYFELSDRRFDSPLKSSDIGPVLNHLHRSLAPRSYREFRWPRCLTVGGVFEIIRKQVFAPFFTIKPRPEVLSSLRKEFVTDWNRRLNWMEVIRVYRFSKE